MKQKRIAVLINNYLDVANKPGTHYLCKKILQQGQDLYVFDLEFVNSSRKQQLYKASAKLDGSIHFSKISKRNIDDFDLVIIRTNPGRESFKINDHINALNELTAFEEKVRIVNSPKALLKMIYKNYLLEIPFETVPVGKLIESKSDLDSFLAEHQSIVIKPLLGTQGAGVIKLMASDSFNKKLAFPMLGQKFVKDKLQMDKRICLYRGDIMSIDGSEGAVGRVPKMGEFRSNVYLGATVVKVSIDDKERATINAIKPWLLSNKLDYVGLDMLGGKIIEINSFSPGGIQAYEDFYGKDYGGYLISRLLEDI